MTAVLGIGWAAIVSLPFAIVSQRVEQTRIGLYVGVFNLSVVLRQPLVSLGVGTLLGRIRLTGPEERAWLTEKNHSHRNEPFRRDRPPKWVSVNTYRKHRVRPIGGLAGGEGPARNPQRSARAARRKRKLPHSFRRP